MLERGHQRRRTRLDQTHAPWQKRPARDPGLIKRRLGSWLGRFPAAQRLIEVTVEQNDHGQACGLQITERAEGAAWAQHAPGAYLLLTKCMETDPAPLWR